MGPISQLASIDMAEEYQIAFCTAPDMEVAERLAASMVEQKLAACVNLLPQVTSVYQWQGQIEKEQEILMLIKTEADLMLELGEFLDNQHPYEVPELISCNIEQASASYLQWLSDTLK